ncbi:hypothetical protein DFH28DRAFT_887470 [Melampsora americana]|nr:hypothetical protein DFH28DRAFT_887470 [Melampsora americana]
MNESNHLDYYQIIGVSAQADSHEIRTAYRKASLKVHPDRNPDDPLAGEKFHKLKIALETLLDPIKRSEFDLKLSIRSSKAKRDERLNSKRKTMLADLEERERKLEEETQQMREKKRRLDELKLAGAKLRKAKEDSLREKEGFDSNSHLPELHPLRSKETSTSTSKPKIFTRPTHLDSLNYTLKFKWNTKHLPKLNSTESLQSFILSNSKLSLNEIESILMKPIKDDPSNQDVKLTALVSLKSLESFELVWKLGLEDDRWKKLKVTKISDLID